MKKFICILALAGLCFAPATFAQSDAKASNDSKKESKKDSKKKTKVENRDIADFQKGTPQERATDMTNHLNENLKFTEAQKAKVYQANLQAAEENDKVIQNSTASIKDIRRSLKAINQKRNDAIMGILDASQKTKYDAFRKKLKESRSGK